MKDNKLNKFDLSNLGDETLKSLFMYAYYKVKSAMIMDRFHKISSSRGKDEECFRWRFAENEALLHETQLFSHKVEYLKNKIAELSQKNHDVTALVIGLDSAKENYDRHFHDIQRIAQEKNELVGYDIDFSDLDLDFQGVKKAFEAMDSEYQQKVMACFAGSASNYDISLSSLQPSGSSMGE